MLSAEACEECGALLMPPDVAAHMAWHIGVRRRESDVRELALATVSALEGVSTVQDIDGARLDLLEGDHV